MSMVMERGFGAESAETEGTRDVWQAIGRGLRCRCPACGEGRIFNKYLKVNESCPVCHEELFHQRADDAPPYVTILVVGHVIGAAMLTVEEVSPYLPIWIHAIVWPALTLIMSLALLPRFKGALIGLQWANRMHGFATAVPAFARRTGTPGDL